MARLSILTQDEINALYAIPTLDDEERSFLFSLDIIAKALGDIARARGMSQIARDTGLSRESLYRSLDGEHIPSFDTILKVTKALGIHLHADPV
jgi:probable addiction module antidote protein